MIAQLGLLIMASHCWMALMNLYISPGVIWPRVVLITVVDALRFDQRSRVRVHARRGAAVGLFALLRNEGAASACRWPGHWWRNIPAPRTWREHRSLEPGSNSFLTTQSFFVRRTGDLAASQQMALQSLETYASGQVRSPS